MMASMDRRAGLRISSAALAFAAALGVSGMVAAQETQDAPDRWLPWVGCWEPSATAQAGVRPGDAVCVAARPGLASVELITLADHRVLSRRDLVADGQRRQVDQAGCNGWEQAKWSGDGQRVYLRSELTCQGGTRRITSGVIGMASAQEWLDIQAVEAGGYPVLRAVRYRPASAEVAIAAGIRLPQNQELAVETARTLAAQPLSVDDVAEAARELSLETLELLLYERGGVFQVNATTLAHLADAGVPDRVIDLVVALAFPDRFAVNSAARMVGLRPEEPTAEALANARNPRPSRVYGTFYDPYFGYGNGCYDPYRYCSRNRSYYSPFGWGNPYGWHNTGRPVIIIQPPRDLQPGDVIPGTQRLVKGKGYSRGSRVGDGTGSTSRPSSSVGSSAPRSSTGSSSAGSSGSSSSGSSGSSTRTATRRGGG